MSNCIGHMPLVDNPSLGHHNAFGTKTFNRAHIVTHKQYRPSFTLTHFVHLPETFPLEFRVSDSKYFIDYEDFRFQVSGNRKSQSHFHTAAVVFDRSVQEFFDAAEINNGIELLPDLSTAHSEDGTIEVNILAAR